jgi:hypothetical protein
MFRILGDNITDIDTFYIASNNQYADLASAQNDTIPASIPGVLEDVSLLIGRIIVLSGSNTATAVESAFTTNFGQSLVTQHNSLGGLQGGLGGQFYHLSSADYIGNGTGLTVRTDNASLTNVRLTGSLLGTSSWTINAKTSSLATFINFIPLIATSASWVSASVLINSASYSDTSSWAINAINGGTKLETGSLYPITASWAVSASWAPDVELTSVPSASWVSASVKITTADTASYVVNAISSSYPWTVSNNNIILSDSASTVAIGSSQESLAGLTVQKDTGEPLNDLTNWSNYQQIIYQK